jgi:hypothetical protein
MSSRLPAKLDYVAGVRKPADGQAFVNNLEYGSEVIKVLSLTVAGSNSSPPLEPDGEIATAER